MWRLIVAVQSMLMTSSQENLPPTREHFESKCKFESRTIALDSARSRVQLLSTRLREECSGLQLLSTRRCIQSCVRLQQQRISHMKLYPNNPHIRILHMKLYSNFRGHTLVRKLYRASQGKLRIQRKLNTEGQTTTPYFGPICVGGGVRAECARRPPRLGYVDSSLAP